ncbi:hypothetical protein TNCV_4787011 [Trichonephila clavipes]|nr:hypothetical protein TNCV_4787011 [Trichonephila clavipes]
MRQIGKGFAGAFKLCSTLNLPRLTKAAYKNQDAKFLKVVQKVAEESMKIAATEIVEKKQNISSDILLKKAPHLILQEYRLHSVHLSMHPTEKLWGGVPAFNIVHHDAKLSVPPKPSGRVVAHRASTPLVRILLPFWARSPQPFIPTAVDR